MSLDDEILVILKSRPGVFASGEEISKELKVSRNAVWKQIERLRQIGYGIEGQSHQGYRLVLIPDKLLPQEILSNLSTRWVAKEVYSYESLDSTNDTAYRLAEEKVSTGTLVVADEQKKGKGRLGRRWLSPKGEGLYLSLVLRPRLSPVQVSRLTLAAAVAAVRAIRSETGLELGIRWPNDLLVDSKKVGGILTEMSAQPDQIQFVILGIGINVNTPPSRLPPEGTSLKAALGRGIARLPLLKRLLVELEMAIEKAQTDRFEDLLQEWAMYSSTLNRRVRVQLVNRFIEGTAASIDTDGGLRVRTDQGMEEKVLSGDILFLRDGAPSGPLRRSSRFDKSKTRRVSEASKPEVPL